MSRWSAEIWVWVAKRRSSHSRKVYTARHFLVKDILHDDGLVGGKFQKLGQCLGIIGRQVFQVIAAVKTLSRQSLGATRSRKVAILTKGA